jgi:DNA-binding response OmpR family regulator
MRGRLRSVAARLLPERQAEVPPVTPAPEVAASPDLVVATADPSLMRMLSFALDQMRLPHQSFTSGTVVLQRLLDLPRGGRPTVVVLDVDLPGVDGHAILERLGVERPDAFLIVVLSSHADESVQVRSLLAGALDHLAKPFNVRVLMAKLQRWVRIARHYEVAA